MNPSLLLGAIVTIPVHIAAPTAHCAMWRKGVECRVGRVVEALPHLISVQFFGYKTPWDYSLREAAQFEVNATIGQEHSNGYTPLAHLPHCKQHYSIGAQVMTPLSAL